MTAPRNPSRPPADATLIAVCANQAWNLVNFRGRLISALIADGYRVLAIAPPDPVMEQRLRALGCDFAPLAFDAAGLSPRRDLATLAALVGILRRHRPKALLSWTVKPNIYGALAARITGVAALPNVTGLGTAFIRRTLLTMLVSRLYRAGFAKAAAVFFENATDADEFVAAGLARREQVRVVPGTGIDPQHFAPPPGGRPPGRKFLLIARLLADKGVREFAEAARRVRELRPETRFGLLGFLDVANRTAISRAEVEQWVSEGRLEYQPPLDDVRPAVAAADIVVLPSYREGLSRVLLEAAAMGRPLVATDVPGCREVVRDGINGFLCAPRDAADLTRAMLAAADLDDRQWQAMADAGRAHIVSDFSEPAVFDTYRAALAGAGITPRGDGG